MISEVILGYDYAGTMVHDGRVAYDGFPHARHQQCVTLLETDTRRVKALFTQALALRDRRDAGTIRPHSLAVARGRLEHPLDDLLADRFSHPDNRRSRNHLDRYRDCLLTFLYNPHIEVSNWPAEEAIRPAVVNRKVFGGNRTDTRSWAQEVLGSLFTTCRQRGQDLSHVLSHLLCLRPQHRLPYIQNLLPVPSG